MAYIPYRRDPSAFRFPLPNRIWKHHLKYPEFSVLAYLHYRHHRRLLDRVSPAELTGTLGLKPGAVRRILDVLTRQGLVTQDLVPAEDGAKFFSLPDEVFHLDLGCAAIAVYAFLLYRENRKTYQCTLSYKAIGHAIGASNNTVRKYVLELEAAGLIATNRTVVVGADGMERNGCLRYTILPVQSALELRYQQRMAVLDAAVERQRVKERLTASARKGGPAG